MSRKIPCFGRSKLHLDPLQQQKRVLLNVISSGTFDSEVLSKRRRKEKDEVKAKAEEYKDD
jgi:hypothetical protein